MSSSALSFVEWIQEAIDGNASFDPLGDAEESLLRSRYGSFPKKWLQIFAGRMDEAQELAAAAAAAPPTADEFLQSLPNILNESGELNAFVATVCRELMGSEGLSQAELPRATLAFTVAIIAAAVDKRHLFLFQNLSVCLTCLLKLASLSLEASSFYAGGTSAELAAMWEDLQIHAMAHDWAISALCHYFNTVLKPSWYPAPANELEVGTLQVLYDAVLSGVSCTLKQLNHTMHTFGHIDLHSEAAVWAHCAHALAGNYNTSLCRPAQELPLQE